MFTLSKTMRHRLEGYLLLLDRQPLSNALCHEVCLLLCEKFSPKTISILLSKAKLVLLGLNKSKNAKQRWHPLVISLTAYCRFLTTKSMFNVLPGLLLILTLHLRIIKLEHKCAMNANLTRSGDAQHVLDETRGSLCCPKIGDIEREERASVRLHRKREVVVIVVVVINQKSTM